MRLSARPHGGGDPEAANSERVALGSRLRGNERMNGAKCARLHTIARKSMSHAEALHTLHPADGATDAVTRFIGQLSYAAIPEEARYYARRHLLDTIGVMISGAGGAIATRAEAVLAA